MGEVRTCRDACRAPKGSIGAFAAHPSHMWADIQQLVRHARPKDTGPADRLAANQTSHGGHDNRAGKNRGDNAVPKDRPACDCRHDMAHDATLPPLRELVLKPPAAKRPPSIVAQVLAERVCSPARG